MMEDAQECIMAMMERESAHYKCPNYLEMECTCYGCDSSCMVTASQRAALHTLEECALVVTDPCWSASITKKTINKVPSVTCFKDFERRFRSESSECAPDCKSRLYPPYPSENSLQFWREQMYDWSCMVADSYNVADRSAVVASSFHLLDRFVANELASTSLPITREDFQLFSMTCLYTSIKVLDGHKLTVSALVHMSRGFYKPADIVATEQDILKALQWRITPPTAISYCRLLWEFFPTDQPWESLSPACCTLTELTVSDSSFLGYSNSVTSLAVLVLAVRSHGYEEKCIQDLMVRVQPFLKINEDEYVEVYRMLENLF